MNKTYTLYPPKTLYKFSKITIPKEIQVIFVSGKVKLERGRSYQTVTTRIFRHRLEIIGTGISIENPNDERDDKTGRQVAFKRAVQSMAVAKKLSGHGRKRLDKLFRCAYYNARRR